MTWLDQAHLTWIYQHVIERSWLSLASAPLVVLGYFLLGRRRRAGWLCLIASQAGLLAIALVDGQVGLLVVVVPIWMAARNWLRWGRAAGAPA